MIKTKNTKTNKSKSKKTTKKIAKKTTKKIAKKTTKKIAKKTTEKTTKKITKRKSPTKSATNYKIGTIKKGNDNNDWIISKNKNGVKRWIRHYKEYKFTNVNVEVQRSPMKCNIVLDEKDFVLTIRKNLNKHFSGKTIKLKTKTVEISFHKKYNLFGFAFTHNGMNYIVYDKTTKKKFDKIKGFFKTNKNYEISDKFYEYKKEYPKNWIGHLVEMSVSKMKKLKKGMYYMAWGTGSGADPIYLVKKLNIPKSKLLHKKLIKLNPKLYK